MKTAMRRDGDEDAPQETNGTPHETDTGRTAP